MANLDRHVRGYVRTADVDEAAANPDHLSVELWVTDRRNDEQYVRWRAAHYLNGSLARSLELRPGDDVEVVLVADRRGEFTAKSYIENHTRGVVYELNRKRRRWPFG